MKVILALLFLSSTVFAAKPAYEINVDLSLDGKHIFGPRIITPEGEKAIVTHTVKDGKYFVEVTAKEDVIQGNKGILLNFVVGKEDKSGKRTVISTPAMFADEKKQAEITVGSKGQPEMKLGAIAERISL